MQSSPVVSTAPAPPPVGATAGGIYYNEHDPKAAAWLRELIRAGEIPAGVVDERSIVDVKPDELTTYTQCHFFAGIGGWPLALRWAGWPDTTPVWTGSCPCQPFSSAGQRKGHADERHLWPAFHALIAECRPTTVFGEQVASADGREWLAGVRADLEKEDYPSRAVDIPACAVNAPHIRQRLYWVACNMENSISNGCEQQRSSEIASLQGECPQRKGKFSPPGLDGELSGRVEGFRGPFVWERPDYAINDKWWERENSLQQSAVGNTDAMRKLQPQGIISEQRRRTGDTSGIHMADADEQRTQVSPPGQFTAIEEPWRFSDTFWHDAEWLTGADGKTRRAKPGVRLLAHGVPNRVGRLRGYGNAIVPQVAEQVIRSFMEVHGEQSRT